MNDDANSASPAPAPKAAREISSIAFPYLDLDDAVAVARVMHERGGVPMDRDQLAAAFGQVPTSGAFNNKVSTARLFGLIDNMSGRYQLTPLGFDILDPAREAAARAEAFLNVPLYRRTFEEFKGRQLPPRPLGLETAFVNFGVSSKQKDKARFAFERSARSAGFFASAAEDRLVQPVIRERAGDSESRAAHDDSSSERDNAGSKGGNRGAHSNLSGLSPFITGLLDKLPDEHTEWPTAERAKWLKAAAQIFDLMYESGDDRAVQVSVGPRG